MPDVSIKPGIEVLHFGEVVACPFDEPTIAAIEAAFAEHKIGWVKIDAGFVTISHWCAEQRAVLHPIIGGDR